MKLILREFSRSEVVSAPAGTRVSDIVQMMKSKNVGSVVITEQDRPVGIITDRDVLLRVVAEKRDPDTMAVSDVMTRDPMVFPGDIGVHEAVERLEGKWFRRIPIVDADRRLIGIISIDDLMQLLNREMTSLTSIVQEQMPAI